MELLTKIDELLNKIDTAENSEIIENVENVEENESITLTSDTSTQTIDNVIINNANDESEKQNESSEDAKADESLAKILQVVEKQQERIDSLNAQIAKLVQNGANVNDGQSKTVEHLPSAVPAEYESLKDLDYSI